MIILNNDEISAVLSMDNCLRFLERAYLEQARGTAVNRPRSDMIWPEDKFKAFLDSGYVRTESSKAISVGDIADYSLLRALK